MNDCAFALFFFFFKQKTAYEMELRLEFRRVLFRSPCRSRERPPSPCAPWRRIQGGPARTPSSSAWPSRSPRRTASVTFLDACLFQNTLERPKREVTRQLPCDRHHPPLCRVLVLSVAAFH